ncbi:MAG: type II secretion system F family protein [Planctomycetota bacterium]
MIPTSLMPMVASFAAGGAVASVVWWLLFPPKVKPPADATHYQTQRRQQLRRENWVVRHFEGHVETLVHWLDQRQDLAEHPLQMALKTQPAWAHWTSREFMAVKMIEGVIVGGTLFGLFAVMGFMAFAVVLGLGLLVIYPVISRQSIRSAADSRLKRQRTRLPFVIDQVALMMQAGANFEESLRAIAEEDPEHPLTQELRLVLADISAGRTRKEALSELSERIPDREVGELLFSIIKGEELGTPMSTILSDQAEQMRIKRSQWGEKAAAEAEVQIVFPGVLVMIACLIVVLGPILLPAVMNLFGPGE